MNGLVTKGLIFAGYTFMAFVYGAGAYSLAKGGKDMVEMKRRIGNLEKKHNNFVDDTFDEMTDIRRRMTRMELDLTTLEVTTVDGFEIFRNKYNRLREELNLGDEQHIKEYVANDIKACEEAAKDIAEEKCCEKQCNKKKKSE